MTQAQPSQIHAAPVKNSTVKNTLRCVLVLGVIAIVCVTLLSIANRFLQVEVTLDKATASLINQIAPTGKSDDEALSGGYVQMVDLQAGGYSISSIDAYNAQYGTNNQKVRALYTSKNASGTVTYVVESEGKGNDSAIVLLIAYDADKKVSALTVKAQGESYWDKLNLAEVFKTFVGTSGKITNVVAGTGATNSVRGMADAVSIANDFMACLASEATKPTPYKVTDAAMLVKLQIVSSAQNFTCYPVGTATVENMYIGDNGEKIVQASGNGGGYGNVSLLVRVEDGKVADILLLSDTFDPVDDHNSEPLKNRENLRKLFVGKTVEQVEAMRPSNLTADGLSAVTGVTQSGTGLTEAVKAALQFVPSFDASQYEEVGA